MQTPGSPSLKPCWAVSPVWAALLELTASYISPGVHLAFTEVSGAVSRDFPSSPWHLCCPHFSPEHTGSDVPSPSSVPTLSGWLCFIDRICFIGSQMLSKQQMSPHPNFFCLPSGDSATGYKLTLSIAFFLTQPLGRNWMHMSKSSSVSIHSQCISDGFNLVSKAAWKPAALLLVAESRRGNHLPLLNL